MAKVKIGHKVLIIDATYESKGRYHVLSIGSTALVTGVNDDGSISVNGNHQGREIAQGLMPHHYKVIEPDKEEIPVDDEEYRAADDRNKMLYGI